MIRLSNIKKVDNKKWKQVADIALYSLPFLTTAIMTMPVSDNIQKWLIFGINVSIVAFKAISKFTTDEENTNNNVDNITTV